MPTSPDSLREFVNFCREHLSGDEKSEAQTFLTKFFQAFGHAGIQEVGAEFEQRLKKGSKTGKTGFADLVWRSRPGVAGVVIEMKSRGIDLNKHYSQVERYWMRITPNRPRYAILCNFDEFWIFDFENQVDEPVDRVALVDLPERLGAFRFMEFGGQAPLFNNNQVVVTERTARRMGEFFQLVFDRGRSSGFTEFSETQLQRFTLQCVMAMFAEDRRLLPNDLFVSLVQDCKDGRGSTYDLLGGLFMEMNRPGITPAGRFQGVDYFNGGLFSEIQPIELTSEELSFLDVCARDNWSNVRPSIFGNIFEGAIDQDKRHAHGIHFTSEVDIRQIVRPTISDYWEERIDQARTIGELNRLQLELQSYRVLDPACGSGNFLYVAYQELKRIERLLIDRIAERRQRPPEQMEIGFVTPTQFYGMDTNGFAVQLARVTMMIARKIAVDKYELDEPTLPLDTLDQNIVCRDALFSEWPKADAVIGNPPFLGGSRMRQELGDEYAESVFREFSEVKDKVDFCTYWFRRSHNHIDSNGRVGLVGTNSITQGLSRAASLDYVTKNGGFIYEAISTQIWSGTAKVHVSIANWSRQPQNACHLDGKKVKAINSSLKSSIDVSNASRLNANSNYCFEGVKPTGSGFLVRPEVVDRWIAYDSSNEEVLKLYSDANHLTKDIDGRPTRWIIDFNNLSLESASRYRIPFEHVKTYVKPLRDNNRQELTRDYWWQHGRKRTLMRRRLLDVSRYFIVPAHSKWFIFLTAPLNWLPSNSTKVVVSDDIYILGVLTSSTHRQWVKAQSSTLKGDVRYTHNTCFETFPFPQSPGDALIRKIRNSMEALYEYRSEQMNKQRWGITQLYNAFFHEPASQLYKLHAQLDALVMKAYGFSPDDDILEKLLELNLELADREAQGESVVGPWAPES